METQETGNYTINKLLGKGANSMVYLATDNETGKKVSMKLVKTEKLTKMVSNKLKNEIDIFRNVFEDNFHKNVIKFIEYIQTTNGIMIITEYIENSEELYKMKNEYFSLNSENILNILDLLYQLADGLEFIHSNNIIHRDIKPQNILVKGYIPIIIDFDLSCINTICKNVQTGTPNYMAPEFWRNDPKVDFFKADIYSLGVIFYFIVNNKKIPYAPKEKSIESLKYEILNNEPIPSNSGIKDLDNLVMKMISKYDVDRPTLLEIKDVIQLVIKNI